VSDVLVGGDEKNPSRADIELWDCSGDHKFENCWPAIANEMGGVILVCDPELDKEHNKDLQTWYGFYVEQQSMRDGQAIVFAHSKSGQPANHRPRLSGGVAKLPVILTSTAADGEDLKKGFKAWLGKMLSSLSERREQEEMNILNNR